MRFVILKALTDLNDVAACWPYASIEATALWVVPADDQAQAERFADERFPNRPHVVLSLEESESIVRQHLANLHRGRAA